MSWNIDLMVGPPKDRALARPDPEAGIATGEPAEVWIAIDAKTVMTEHGKARRNRQRDLNALHDILHRKNSKTIVGGLVALNIAERFQSPLRTGVTIHKNIARLVEETVKLFGDIPRSCPENPQGLDALGLIVLEHTNIAGDSSTLFRQKPAPQAGDRNHYQTFLDDLCQAFTHRFSK